MDTRFAFDIVPQPTEDTCGPTCLHAVYRYYGDAIPLGQLIDEIPKLHDHSTLDAFLALHALRRGYRATLYTFNLSLFDPTWFSLSRSKFRKKLREQLEVKSGPKLEDATRAYIEFLDLGGRLRLKDPTPSLLRGYLKRGRPILTGLSSTWLYRAARELEDTRADDVRGEPAGHFVVLHGYDRATREVSVADPYAHNPHAEGLQYRVKMERLIAAMLLGVVSYDCNWLVIEPPAERSAQS
jgi:hypothetical protein